MLSNSLHVTLNSALLWFKLLAETIIKDGFKLNPYDLCVAKMIDKKQCTTMHHVDETKISHMNPLVINNVLNLLESNFGKLKIVRGKKHEFIGMKITC